MIRPNQSRSKNGFLYFCIPFTILGYALVLTNPGFAIVLLGIGLNMASLLIFSNVFMATDRPSSIAYHTGAVLAAFNLLMVVGKGLSVWFLP